MTRSSTHLPLSLNPFVGREDEIQQLRQLLDLGARLVTIVGPGGAGKTRLVGEFAVRVHTSGEAVLFVDLTRHESAASAILELLKPGSTPSVDLAVREVAGRSGSNLLVVLDNLEHVVDEAAALVPRLLSLDGVRVIGTSREPLRLGGEQVLRLGPLTDTEALELFNLRARSVIPEFDAGDQSRDAIREIIARVDHLPLGIELAASRINVLSPRGLAERLTKRMSALKSKDRDRPERHRTVAATAQWSWELLKQEERAVLAQLGVFRDEFSLEAAEAVVDVDGVDVVDSIDDLVDRSMLERKGDRRFRLFQTVYGLASDEFESNESDPGTFYDRHANFFSTRVLETTRIQRALLRHELSELKHAVERTHGATRARVMAAIASIVTEFGGMDETLVDAARREAESTDDPQVRAELELAISQAMFDHADLQACVSWADKALKSLSDSDHDELKAQILIAKGNALLWIGEKEGALDALTRAVEAARSAGCPGAEVKARSTLALALSTLDRPAEAQDHLATALNRARANGEPTLIARLLVNVGLWHLEQEQYADADTALDECLELLEDVENRRFEARALAASARVKLALGDIDEARQRYLDASHSAGEHGQVSTRLEALIGLGSLRSSSSDRVYLVKAVDLAQNAGSEEDEAVARSMLMFLDMCFGSFPLASHQARRILDNEAVPQGWRVVIEAMRALTTGWSGDSEDLPEPGDDIWLEALVACVDKIIKASSASTSDQTSAVLQTRESLQRLAQLYPDRKLSGWPTQHVVHVLQDLVGERFGDIDLKTLTLHPEGRFYQPPDGDVIDFSRRGALRGVLVGLARAREASPGRAVELEEVLELGWPGEIITHEAGASRVYSAIRTLRNNGLEDVLQTNDEGYFVAPDIAIVWDEDLST